MNENIFPSQNFRVFLFLFFERALDVPFLCVIEFFGPTRVLFGRQVFEEVATDTGYLVAVLQSAILKNIIINIKANRLQVCYQIFGLKMIQPDVQWFLFSKTTCYYSLMLVSILSRIIVIKRNKATWWQVKNISIFFIPL